MNQPAHLDRKAVESAEGLIADLSDLIDVTLTPLAGLSLFLEDEPLPQAIVGAMALSISEARQQLPALRQALRDLPVRGES